MTAIFAISISSLNFLSGSETFAYGQTSSADSIVENEKTIRGYFNIAERLYLDGTYQYEYYLFTESDKTHTQQPPIRLYFDQISSEIIDLSGKDVQVVYDENTSLLNDQKSINSKNINVKSITALSSQSAEFREDNDGDPRFIPSRLDSVTIIVKYNDDTATARINPDSYFETLFYTGTNSLSQYWASNSYQKTTTSGTVALSDWQVLPRDIDAYCASSDPNFPDRCDQNKHDAILWRTFLIPDSIALVDSVVDFDGVDNIIQNDLPDKLKQNQPNDDIDLIRIIINSQMPDGGDFGLAFFDPVPISTNEGNLYVYVSFVSDTNTSTSLVGPQAGGGIGITAHEMGHNFNWYHTPPPFSNNRYADPWSIMSLGGYGDTNGAPAPIAFNKKQASWIEADEVRNIVSSQIAQFDLSYLGDSTPSSNYIMAQVPFGSNGEYYTVEARKDLTYDQTPSNNNGLIIYHYNPNGHPNTGEPTATTSIVNATNPIDLINIHLTPGQSFYDSITKINVTSISNNADTITVQIKNNPGPAVKPVADAGSDQAVYSGDTVSLDGSGSFPQPVTYAWTTISGPAGFSFSSTDESPSFTAPSVASSTNIRLQLIVEKDGQYSNPDTITINVSPVPASTSFNHVLTFEPSNAASNDRFGLESTISGDGSVLAVSSPMHSNFRGTVIYFDVIGNPLGTLIDNPAGDRDGYFGGSMASIGNTQFLIGAEGNELDNDDDGMVYLFDTSGTQIYRFDMPLAYQDEDGLFGWSVASVGNNKFVGGAPGLPDNSLSQAGKAFLFTSLSAQTNVELNSNSPEADAKFGWSVGSTNNGNTIMVGAPFDDISSNSDAGSVTLFDGSGNYVKTITSPSSSIDGLFGYEITHAGSGEFLVSEPGESKVHLYDSSGAHQTTYTMPAPFRNISSSQFHSFDINSITEEDKLSSTYLFFESLNRTSLFDSKTAYDITTVILNPGGFGIETEYIADTDLVAIASSSTDTVFVYERATGNYLTSFDDDTNQPTWLGQSLTDLGNGRIAVGAPIDYDNITLSGLTYIFRDTNALNQPPISNAGTDQSITEETQTTLDGSMSGDPDGDSITYIWTQVDNGAPTFDPADTESPTFTAPDVSGDTVFRFSLTVNDRTLGSASDFVDVTVIDDDKTVPSQVTNLSATAITYTQIDLSWDTPAHNGSPITGYKIERDTGSGFVTIVSATLSASTTLSDSPYNAGVYGYTALTAGTTAIYKVSAINAMGTGSASSTATATTPSLNSAPILDFIGNKSVDELTELTFTASATDSDGDTLSYSLTNSPPSGAAINSATGVFTWTPTESQTTSTFDVTVSDGNGGTDSEEITVTVNEINVSPVLAFIGDKSVDELTELTFTASATDSDVPADTLTFSLTNSPPSGAAINSATGVFTWTPTESQTTSTFDVTVSDGNGGTDSEEITVTVNNLATIPDEPTALSATPGNSQVSLSWSAPVNDGGSPITDYTIQYKKWNTQNWSTFDDGTSTDTTATVTGLSNGWVYNFRVAAVNVEGTGQYSDVITVTVNEINTPPVLAPISDKTISLDTNLAFPLIATDADGDHLTYSSAGYIYHGEAITRDGMFLWTPTNVGQYDFAISVSDGIASDTKTFRITVNDLVTIPDAPII